MARRPRRNHSPAFKAKVALAALKEAMRRHGKPEITNTDQGSQFTSIDFIKTLKDVDIQISMDAKGAWRDNVFVERLWRSIRYEEVYLRAYDSVSTSAGKSGQVPGLLQQAQTAFISGRTNARSGISQTIATNPGGGITEREIHLTNGSKLFKTNELPLVETVRLKKSCRRCEKVVQSAAPTRPIPRGMAGPGLLAHILVAKFDDHLPLYRQGEIFARLR